MAQLIHGLRADRVRSNLLEVRQELVAACQRAGRDPAGVEILAATKYVPLAEMATLQEAGIELVGENRAQDLQVKVAADGPRFQWDFIGQLQSRKVRTIVPLVRLIHSVASSSALRELGRYAEQARPGLRILVEVNVAREPGKAGVAPEALGAFIAASPVPVAGLMTMPPLSEDPQDSRRWFAALRELAAAHQLEHLSMGTTQDYVVAAEEGATIVRIGSRLYT